MKTYVGILGGGNISRTHLRAAMEIEDVGVSAVYGQNAVKVQELAQEAGATAYEQLEFFLDHHPLDVVLIGSPSGTHAEQGIQAAQRGLHVLTEKPIDITTERTDQLIQSCREAGVQLGVFFQDRVADDLRELKTLLDSGKLGRPLLASAHVRWHRDSEYYSSARWRGTWALDGGGALMNQGSHTVDLLLWLLGDVTKVSAHAGTLLHDIEVEDTVTAALEFANGALGTIEAATCAYPGYPRRLVVTTTEGTITVEHDRVVAADLRNPIEGYFETEEADQNPSSSSAVVSDVRGHRRLLQDFLDSIRDQRSPLCSGLEGRRSVELIQAIYRSAKLGRAVQL